MQYNCVHNARSLGWTGAVSKALSPSLCRYFDFFLFCYCTNYFWLPLHSSSVSPQRFSQYGGMALEPPVSSHLGLQRSGTLNAQRKVARTDSCGVQPSEIMMNRKSGASVPPKVSARGIFQPCHIDMNLYGNMMNWLWRITFLRALIEEVSTNRSGFWPSSSPAAVQQYHFLSWDVNTALFLFSFSYRPVFAMILL